MMMLFLSFSLSLVVRVPLSVVFWLAHFLLVPWFIPSVQCRLRQRRRSNIAPDTGENVRAVEAVAAAADDGRVSI